jgi:3-hydroxybutyryl-CoA dehydratase
LGAYILKIKVGDTASCSKQITNAAIQAFAELSGDHNPLHLDDGYAATTRFGKRVAHGMLSASLISAVLGNELPGLGSIFVSQTINYLAPVFSGDTVTARVTVTKTRDDKPIVTLATTCENQHGETVIKGEAVILIE